MANSILRLLTAGTLLVLSPVAFAHKKWDAPNIVTRNCSGCHGIDGNAQQPSVPRLAGLTPAYMEQKMKAFQSQASPPVDELFSWIVPSPAAHPGPSSLEARINMIGIAHDITDTQAKTSAAWYAEQEPGRGRSGDASLIAQGNTIFFKGLPAQGLLACQGCHGANAGGKGNVPRLAGQNSSYVIAELDKFKSGDRQHAPEMTMVAEHVDTEQFRALAAYLQSR